MSEQDNNQSESNSDYMREQLEIRKAKASKMTREEFFEHIKDSIIEKPFRLEMFYLPEKDIFVIQGDENGLKQFGQIVLSLARPAEITGHHTHWDTTTTTYMNVQEVIVQRVNTHDDERAIKHS